MAFSDYFDRFLDSVDGYVVSTTGGDETETIPPSTTTGVTPGTEGPLAGVSNQMLWVGGALLAGIVLLALKK